MPLLAVAVSLVSVLVSWVLAARAGAHAQGKADEQRARLFKSLEDYADGCRRSLEAHAIVVRREIEALGVALRRDIDGLATDLEAMRENHREELRRLYERSDKNSLDIAALRVVVFKNGPG